MTNTTESKTLHLIAFLENVGNELLAIQENGANAHGKHEDQVNNYATEGDLHAEKRILAYLKAHYPNDSIISEETEGMTVGDSGFVWHIDPIDGTTNYLRGNEYWGVSIARVNAMDRNTDIAVVHAPALNKTWYTYATTDKAFVKKNHNTKPIVKPNYPGKILMTGLPYDKTIRTRLLEALPTMAEDYVDVRHVGSAALGLTLLAEGMCDGLVLWTAKSWDIMAGKEIAEKTGHKFNITLDKNGDYEIVAI